jgi:hypothetical protein
MNDDLGSDWFERFVRARTDYSVDSEYHGHKIPAWAREEVCYFCRFPASHKVEEDHSYQAFVTHPYTAYVCCDHFWGPCRLTDAPVCMKCGHYWYDHEQHVDKWFDGEPGEYCLVNMGMGDPCGCAERKP